MLRNVEEVKTVTRPALRYFGGKFRLAPWIIAQFPGHVCYVEPFGGAAGVLLRKEPSLFEIYNDLDGTVVNFFRVLRDQPDELLRAISLTPYARAEQLLAFEEDVNLDPVESARRLYVRAWQSHGGGRTQWRTGWRYQVTNKRGKSSIADWSQVDHLEAIIARLKMVQIDNDDCLRVIERYDRPDTLFYLDPPYVASTRSLRWNKKAYSFEINDEYHRRLAEKLNGIQGMALLSGKPCDLYDELYGNWVRMEKTVPTDFQSKTVEALWLSPNVVKRQSQGRLGI
jgi:DNA adenine methylase